MAVCRRDWRSEGAAEGRRGDVESCIPQRMRHSKGGGARGSNENQSRTWADLTVFRVKSGLFAWPRGHNIYIGAGIKFNVLSRIQHGQKRGNHQPFRLLKRVNQVIVTQTQRRLLKMTDNVSDLCQDGEQMSPKQEKTTIINVNVYKCYINNTFLE